MQKELELVQLLASLNEKIDTVEKQLKHSTDLTIKIERLVEDVSSIKSSMSELHFMLMGDGQNMGLVTRVAGLEKNFDDRERFMEKTVEPAMEKQQRILFDLETFKEVVEEDIDDDGVIRKKYYGIRRIPDIMAMKEMEAYKEGVNVDRLVSLAALISYVKIKESNTEKAVRVENEYENKLEKSQNLYKLNNSAFRNLGKRGSSSGMKMKKSPFKRLR